MALASPAVFALTAGLLAPPALAEMLGPEPDASAGEASESIDGELDEDDREAAKQAFDDGLTAVAADEYAQAVASFEHAYELRPHPVTLFNLALALEKSERLPEAWTLFDDVVDIVDSNAERREIRRHMRAIADQIAVVEVDASPQRRLCIDGLAMPAGETSDYRFAVDPGAHEFILDDHVFPIDLDAGDRRVLLLDDADELLGGRRDGPLMPAMIGTSIGTGALALALGIGAAAVDQPTTKTGLAAGAATSAGLAVAAGVVALLIQTKTIRDPSVRTQLDDGAACPGSPVLEQRLDLRLGPTIERPPEFALLPAPSMPVPDLAAFPHPRGIQPPRGQL